MNKPTLGQGNQVQTLILQSGISEEKLQRLIESGMLSDLLRADITTESRTTLRKALYQHKMSTYPVQIPKRTLEEATAAGKYDSVNDNITAMNFEVCESDFGDKDLILVQFEKDISSEDVVKEMDKMGLRPGRPMELLAIGEKFPDLQREGTIAALGSSCLVGVCRRVRCLYQFASKRYLGLYDWHGGWKAGDRFLAVRN